MHLHEVLRLSGQSLIRNQRRAMLTVLGIVIGIASVILMLSIGQSAERYLLSQVASFGADLVLIAPGRGDAKRGGPPDASIKQTLTYQDYQSLRREPWVRLANTSVVTHDVVAANHVATFAQVVGTGPDEAIMFAYTLAQGRFLLNEDVDGHVRTVVLGAGISQKLFANDQPLGRLMKVGRQTFRVAGVMSPGGTRFFTNVDEQVYIPVTTAMDVYGRTRVNFISVTADKLTIQEAKTRVREVLRVTHKLHNSQGDLSRDDFRVGSQEDAARNVAVIGRVLQILLGSIAAISLVVGGIGIMNIMFVTVSERTQEIGLRRAIGATRQDVLRQFLSEAILLTMLGGIIGIVVGISLSAIAIAVINHLQNGWVFIVSWPGVFVAFAVSVAIGLVFGYVPARRAAGLKPIEALRHE